MLATFLQIVVAVGVFGCFACNEANKVASPVDRSSDLVNNEIRESPNSNIKNSNVEECSVIVWSGSFDRGILKWARDEIFLEIDGRSVPLFKPSFEKLHQAQLRRVKAELTTKPFLGDSDYLKGRQILNFQSDASVEVASLIGPFATFELSYMSILEGSPSTYNSWWLTVDLTKSRRDSPFSERVSDNYEGAGNTSLMKIYSDQDILKALMENGQVARSILKQGRDVEPVTVSELLENKGKHKDNPRVEVEGGRHITPYSLEHFAFDRMEENKAIVLLATVDFASTSNHEVAYIEIALPFPDRLLREAGPGAGSGNKPFFRREIKNSTKGCQSSFSGKDTVNI